MCYNIRYMTEEIKEPLGQGGIEAKPGAVPKSETESTKEVAVEKVPEGAPEDFGAEVSISDVVPVTSPLPVVVPEKKDPDLQLIEDILAGDLMKVYQDLSPEKQKEFKIKGEETASKIKELIDTAKVKAKSVLQLIKEWLKLIPGINRFFLEQEAKIKTDQVMELVEKKKSIIE